MAGRIRTVKPEILDDEVAAGLSDAAWRLWVSSWLVSDDYGRMRANLNYLKGAIFWHPNHADKTPERVDELMAELASAGLIQRYEVEAQEYACVPKWNRHQKVSHPGKPRIPGPPSGEFPESFPRPSGEFPEALLPDRRPATTTTTTTSDHESVADGDPGGVEGESVSRETMCALCGIEPRRASNQRWCAKCHAEWQRENRPSHTELPDEQRHKANCRSYTNVLVRRGVLIKATTCDRCGGSPVEAHHHDYDNPRAVEWLCSSCHRSIHGAQPDPGPEPAAVPRKRKRAVKAGKAKNGAPEGYQAFVAAFDEGFRKATGTAPEWGAKQGAMVKRLLKKAGGLDDALARMERMFEIAPRFPAEHPDLGTLVAHWDKFAPRPRNSKRGRCAPRKHEDFTFGEEDL